MNNVTLTNSTRILKFLQSFKLDFNEHSVWSYSRKKYHDSASTKPLIAEAFAFLETTGYIEKLLQPGYYRLTEKGNNFTGWENEPLEERLVATAEPVQKGWINWLLPKKIKDSV